MRQNEPWEIALFFALSLSSPPIGMALSSFLYHPTPEAPPLPSPIYFFPFCLFSPKREITHHGIRQRLTWAIPPRRILIFPGDTAVLDCRREWWAPKKPERAHIPSFPAQTFWVFFNPPLFSFSNQLKVQ